MMIVWMLLLTTITTLLLGASATTQQASALAAADLLCDTAAFSRLACCERQVAADLRLTRMQAAADQLPDLFYRIPREPPRLSWVSFIWSKFIAGAPEKRESADAVDGLVLTSAGHLMSTRLVSRLQGSVVTSSSEQQQAEMDALGWLPLGLQVCWSHDESLTVTVTSASLVASHGDNGDDWEWVEPGSAVAQRRPIGVYASPWDHLHSPMEAASAYVRMLRPVNAVSKSALPKRQPWLPYLSPRDYAFEVIYSCGPEVRIWSTDSKGSTGSRVSVMSPAFCLC